MKIEAPEGLLDKILARIHGEKRLLGVKRRLAVFSIGAAGSAAAFIPVFKMAQLEISNSGFLQFFSLLFSDFGAVAVYWHSFTLSLLETLPAMSLAVFLAITLLFLESLKFLAKDIKSFNQCRFQPR
jgi:ABC-type spermidine/putrescine transport system permease subunit I